MFKNIQKNLLLKYPLLWNTKFVPMLLIGFIIHILFFGLGYIDGTIDFSNKIFVDIEVTAVLFGVLLVIIITILWLVNYFKNNSLKSYYSKSKNALFYEWIQIFIICLLLTTFYIPFNFGKQLHQRSYFSLEETKNRCETISLADIFIDGHFAETEIDSVLKTNLTQEEIDSLGPNLNERFYEVNNGTNDTNYIKFHKDHVVFNQKKYDDESLLNREIYEFSVISNEQDSVNNLKVKNWLHSNNQEEIKQLMTNYLELIHEHNLLTNLSVKSWFESTYKAPNFISFLYIFPYLDKTEAEYDYNYNTTYEKAFSNNKKAVKYSKYYVQQDVLKKKYNIVSNAYTNSFIEFEALLAFFYGALVFSLLIFSFKVTSGKSWLIAIVVTGVLNIIYGIFAAVSGSGEIYSYLMLFTLIGILFYFISICLKKRKKEYSRITLNLLLWSFFMIIPIIYFLIQEYYQAKKYSYEYIHNSPEYNWLRDHVVHMFTINFIIAVVALFFLSKMIRNWKGIAEE